MSKSAATPEWLTDLTRACEKLADAQIELLKQVGDRNGQYWKELYRIRLELNRELHRLRQFHERGEI